jgi:hypothetical protein
MKRWSHLNVENIKRKKCVKIKESGGYISTKGKCSKIKATDQNDKCSNFKGTDGVAN